MKYFHVASLILLFVVCVEFSLAIEVRHSLTEKFAWKHIEFIWPDDATKEDAIINGLYKSENNLPLGLDVWGDKLFITVPRWKSGVASALNYVNLTDASNEKSPKLVPYPSWKTNFLKLDTKPTNHSADNVTTTETPIVDPQNEMSRIISSFQIRVDECNRLWVMDTGLTDVLGDKQQIKPPALVIFNLETDELIRRYEFKQSDIQTGSFFANLVVDITKNECENAFAYVPDLGGYGVVVYSFKENKSWRVKHNFFHFDPLSGNYKVGSVNFQWTDGVFGMALGKATPDGVRTVYFHALASTKEFSVPNYVLKNETRSKNPLSYYDYSMIGDRGAKGQASAECFDEKTNVLFYTQVNKDAIGCWNVNKTFSRETQGIVDSDSKSLVFPNDVKVDRNSNLWVLSNQMPVFIYSKLSIDHINYRILVGKASEVIKNTPCDPNYVAKKKA